LPIRAIYLVRIDIGQYQISQCLEEIDKEKERINMKTFLFIVTLIVCLFAQPYNVSVLHSTITGFAYDSLKASDVFYVGDYQGVSILIKTSIQDSAKFYYCYQRGYWDGNAIVWKRPSVLIDTFNTLTSGNFQTTGSYVQTGRADTDLVQAIDTIGLGGKTQQITYFCPIRSPYMRIWCKGLTGNKHSAYTIYVNASMTKYNRVDVGTIKQADE
jgi:hypothetical protein